MGAIVEGTIFLGDPAVDKAQSVKFVSTEAICV